MSKSEHLPGIHTVHAVLRFKPERIQSIWVEQNKSNNRIDKLINQARDLGIPIQSMQRHKLDTLSEGSQHQGIVATCSPTQFCHEQDLLIRCAETSESLLFLILDEVSDPHNVGACLRTADAAGADAVIFPQRNSAPISAIVHKISSGASLKLDLVKTSNLARFLESIKKIGVWVYGADGEAEQSIYSLDLNKSCALVLGAEGQGLRNLTKKTCDQLCALPMLGSVESLNVSVATGIFLYEAVRQRQN